MTEDTLSPLTFEQLRMLLDDVVDGLVVTDRDGRIMYLNDPIRELYGFGELETGGRKGVNLLQFVNETFAFRDMNDEPVPEQEQPLSRALRGQHYRDVELRVTHVGTGEERVFEFSGTRLEGETPLGVLRIRDVTERHQAERRYRVTFESNPAPTMVVGLDDQTLLEVNDGFAEMTGLACEEAKGLPFADLGLLSVEGELDEAMERLRSGDQVRYQHSTIDQIGGQTRSVLVSARPIELEGKRSGIFTFIDTTDLRRTEDELAESASEVALLNRELDAFNKGVSHDLRTPLRGIEGFSQVLLEEYGEVLGEEGRHYLQRVRSGAVRMGGLIDSMLQLSRISRGQMTPSNVDLGELANQIGRRLAEDYRDREVTLDIESDLVVVGDKHMLRVLMTSLLDNACKFSDEPDVHIRVGSTEDDGETVYYVSDDGRGFDQEYSAKLFEPFQRLHEPEEFDGLGVGLSLAQRVVFRHGGRIWAESSGERGSTFYFTLGSA